MLRTHTEDTSKDAKKPVATQILLTVLPSMFPPLKDPRWNDLKKRHVPIVEEEINGAPREDQKRTVEALRNMVGVEMPSLGEIDWDSELAEFNDLPYPSYYLMPFHSMLGGWLSQQAAMFNRVAMDAIFLDNTPQKCLGVREELAKFVPRDAKLVVDLGAGDFDGPAAVARQLPRARVLAVECSPFMIIVGRRLNRDTLAENLEYRHALAEATGLDGGKADAVTITLVFHECSEEGRRAIMAEVFRLLRPGGTLILTEANDVDTYRGFCEPHKAGWNATDVVKFLDASGFDVIRFVESTAPPAGKVGQRLLTAVAKKPEITAKL